MQKEGRKCQEVRIVWWCGGVWNQALSGRQKCYYGIIVGVLEEVIQKCVPSHTGIGEGGRAVVGNSTALRRMKCMLAGARSSGVVRVGTAFNARCGVGGGRVLPRTIEIQRISCRRDALVVREIELAGRQTQNQGCPELLETETRPRGWRSAVVSGMRRRG